MIVGGSLKQNKASKLKSSKPHLRNSKEYILSNSSSVSFDEDSAPVEGVDPIVVTNSISSQTKLKNPAILF